MTGTSHGRPQGSGRRADEVPELCAGDTILLTSPIATLRLVERGPCYFGVEWPWLTVDRDSVSSWNGLFAFPVDSGSSEWRGSPWRFHRDEPLDVGWLPMAPAKATCWA